MSELNSLVYEGMLLSMEGSVTEIYTNLRELDPRDELDDIMKEHNLSRTEAGIIGGHLCQVAGLMEREIRTFTQDLFENSEPNYVTAFLAPASLCFLFGYAFAKYFGVTNYVPEIGLISGAVGGWLLFGKSRKIMFSWNHRRYTKEIRERTIETLSQLIGAVREETMKKLLENRPSSLCDYCI